MWLLLSTISGPAGVEEDADANEDARRIASVSETGVVAGDWGGMHLDNPNPRGKFRRHGQTRWLYMIIFLFLLRF
jgi:hypothetical protein